MKYIELKLDRPRRLGYGWRDAGDLSRRLGGASLQAMLTRLSEMDPTALNQFLWTGLRNFDRGLKYEEVEEIVQGWIDQGNRITDLLGFILDAMTVCGVIRARKEEPEAEEDPSTRPPMGLT